MAKTVGDSTLLDAWASSGDITEPDLSKIEQGWLLGEQPPHEFFNWIQNTFGQKINHVLQRGVASWDSAKTYAVGDVVGSGGSVWIAQAANTNSTPGPANTDWVVVLTANDFATIGETKVGSSDSLAVTPLGLGSSVFSLGQSIQDLTSSRQPGVSYTNSTGKTILLIIRVVSTSDIESNFGFDVTVDGTLCPGPISYRTSGLSSAAQQSFPINDGESYSVTLVGSTPKIHSWLEYR